MTLNKVAGDIPICLICGFGEPRNSTSWRDVLVAHFARKVCDIKTYLL
jgi:hypothetical protein